MQAKIKRRVKLLAHKSRSHFPYALVALAMVVGVILLFAVMPAMLPSRPSVKGAVYLSAPSSLSDRPPPVSARNVFILDLNSQQVLWQRQADDRIAPASTTKMVTALVAMDHFPLDRLITVTSSFTEGSRVNFQPGEVVSVENLLYAVLVQSANDGAEILAENYTGGREAFVTAMNAKAVEIGLKNTQFKNPTGLDEAGHYSSASDLVRISEALLKDPFLSRIVSTENAIVSGHIVQNVNELLGKVPGVLGMKTGFTDLAGQSLVTYVVRDNHPVLIAVMGSQDRFADSRTLIEWVYSNFVWNP